MADIKQEVPDGDAISWDVKQMTPTITGNRREDISPRRMEDTEHEVATKRRRQSSANSRSNQFEITLNEFRKQNYLCDFTIEIPHHEFRVHRCVLAAKSKYFKQLFQSPLNKMRFDKLKKEGVEICLQYIYTCDYSVDYKVAEATIVAADAFSLNDLKIDILGGLSLSLTSENCLGMEKIASRVKDERLYKKAHDWVISHFEEVIEKDKFFYTISKTDLKNYISALRDPKVIKNGILKWFCHPKNSNRKDEFPAFLKSVVNFRLFTLEDLLTFRDEAQQTMPHGVQYIEQEVISCFRHGKFKVTPEKWKSLKDLFKSLRKPELERAIDLYVIDNLATMSKFESFYEIGKIDLIYYLKSKKLPWSREWEEIIWSVIVKWVKFSKSRQAMLPELLQAINLANFSVTFLRNVVKNDDIVANDTKSLNILVDTLCHLL